MRRTHRWIWIVILPALSALVLLLFGLAEAGAWSLDGSLERQATGVTIEAEPRTSTSALKLVGQVGGRTEDVAVQEDYAYVAVGLRLVVLDVSEAATPTELGSTAPFPDFVVGVTVSGTHSTGSEQAIAYAAAGMAGLRVVDVSTPTAPVEIGFYDTPGYAEKVTVAGGYAYVADSHYGLRIVDVSDPTDPTEVGYAFPLNYVFDVALDGDHAYLAAAGAGLLVVDVSDPARPLEIGTIETPGYAYGVDAVGGIAYVADGWEHLRLVDVSDPTNATEMASYDTPGWSFGVAISGTIAYVADAFMGLQMVDVSDPANPFGLGGEEMSQGHAGRVVVAGNATYVVDRNRGLRVLDVSDPGTPADVGLYGPMGYATAVSVFEGYAYVAAGTYGLRAVDVSDPGHPREVGAYDTQGNAIGVAVDGDRACVAVMCPEIGAGLHAVDISDPADPTGVGFSPQAQGCYRDITTVDGIAYVANEWGLEVIDVSMPATPTLLSCIDLQGAEWGATSGVDVSGTLAYVVGDGGLRVVDVSSPVSATLIALSQAFGAPFDVAVAGNLVYLTAGGSVLKTIDVSDPLDLEQLGEYHGPYMSERVTAVDGTAYLASGSGGLLGIDVSDPANPAVAVSFDTPGHAHAVTVAGDHIYVADGQGGLVVLERVALEQAARVGDDSNGAPPATTWTEAWATLPGEFAHGEEASSFRIGRSGFRQERALASGCGPGNVTPAHRRRAAITCTVTSTADGGPGTLRECIEKAATGDTITFDPDVFPPGKPVTITLESNLHSICHDHVTIDASEAGVILDGRLIENGTGFQVGSSHSTIRGLQIIRFSNAGILVNEDSHHNVIGGDRMVGSGPMGQGNLISGNGQGVGIDGDDNTVLGNFIGTDLTGRHPFGNQGDGIGISIGHGNLVGGTSPGERNVISANGWAGIHLVVHTYGNTIMNNYVGTDVHGQVDLGNYWTGVLLELGCPHNVIQNNLVSGSNWGGVVLADVGTEYNVVTGNLIGVDASGTQALGNRWCGVAVGQSFNRIGGGAPGEGNVIGGNAQGITFQGSRNLILGNTVGSSLDGTHAISNSVGIFSCCAGSHNYIGGTAPGEGNLVSGNVTAGITLGGVERVFVLGNAIGTDGDGVAPLPNGQAGISVEATGHTVIQGNTIAGNGECGVSIGEKSDFSHVRANFIGVAADGVSPLPNGMDGMSIASASTMIGGPYPEDGNTMAFNANAGVRVWTYPGNTIRHNSIYSNQGSGISLGDGGNQELAAPVITVVLCGSVRGTACAGCIVELFSDEEDEGRIYEGTAFADSSGNWTWLGSLNGPYVTATATDEAGNTSPFSAPQMAARHCIYLPLILREED